MTPGAVRVKDLKRRDGFYYLPGDRKYPSVTTILSIIAKPALITWGARTAASLVLEDPDTYDTAEKAASGIYARRDKAADRGSMVHSLAEALDRGGVIEFTEDTPEDVKGYARAYQSFVTVHEPTTLFTEATVWSDKHKYAGTTDLIAVLRDGKTYCIDRKTGKAIYQEAALQLAAYRDADFILPHGDGAKPQPLPHIDATAVVLLRPDGTYDFSVVHAELRYFLAAKELWEWSRGTI